MEMRDRIKAIRNDAGLTQSEFSIRLGFAPTSAASWEKKDAQEPSEPIKLLICKTFGIREEWLKTGEGEMKVDSNVDFLDKLANQHNLGPGGKALLKVATRVIEELDDKSASALLDQLIVLMQDAAAERDGSGVSKPSAESSDSSSAGRSSVG